MLRQAQHEFYEVFSLSLSKALTICLIVCCTFFITHRLNTMTSQIFLRIILSRSHSASLLILAAFAVAFMSASCATIVSDPGELPYDEKIVVEAFLQAGTPLNNVAVSRTVPPLTKVAEYSQFFITDADVEITVDGRSYKATPRIDSLRQTSITGFNTQTSSYITQTSTSAYRSVYGVAGLVVQAGKTYTLTVRWRGKTATAQTRIPAVPVLQDSLRCVAKFDTVTQVYAGRTSRLVQISYQLASTVMASPQEVYQVWMYATAVDTSRGQRTLISLSAYNELGPTSRSDNSSIVLFRLPPENASQQALQPLAMTRQSRSISGYGIGGQYRPPYSFYSEPRGYGVVQAFDVPYYDFTQTLSRNQQFSNGPFSTGGANARWNVTGDGIGAFIGMAVREVPLALP
jgi:hypothetical protein